MKRVIKLFLFFVIATSAMADNEMTYLSFTNSDPNTPRLTFSGSMLRRSSYTVDGYYKSISSNAANISGYTVHLNWKATGRLQDSPVTRVVGTVMNGTGGWARAIIPKDALNSVGDTTFLMSAFDATNRIAFFWNCTVYDAVDQVSDDDFIPPGDETNFYTMAQIDALLTNYIEGSEADGLYVNTGEQVRASLITVVSTNFQTMSTNDTTAQLAFDDIDDLLSNRYTQAQSDTRYVNTGEVVSASLISLSTNNFTAISGGTNVQLAMDSVDDELTNRVRRTGDVMSGGLSGTVFYARQYQVFGNTYGEQSDIVFGTNNAAYGTSASVLGGARNIATSTYAIVVGGSDNYAELISAVVAGSQNTNKGFYTLIGAGRANKIIGGSDATDSIIGGGGDNSVYDRYAFIGGGRFNSITGQYSVIDGGFSNTVTASYSTAGGRRARATNTGVFVWADSTDADFGSTRSDSVRFRAGNGFDVVTTGTNALTENSIPVLTESDPTMRYTTTAITAMTNAAINYSMYFASPTNIYICYTNNWRGSGTNWGRITVSDF